MVRAIEWRWGDRLLYDFRSQCGLSGRRRYRVGIALPGFLLVVLALTNQHSKLIAAERAWTPADSVAVRYLSVDPDDPESWFGASPFKWKASAVGEHDWVVTSPDGQYFF